MLLSHSHLEGHWSSVLNFWQLFESYPHRLQHSYLCLPRNSPSGQVVGSAEQSAAEQSGRGSSSIIAGSLPCILGSACGSSSSSLMVGAQFFFSKSQVHGCWWHCCSDLMVSHATYVPIFMQRFGCHSHRSSGQCSFS